MLQLIFLNAAQSQIAKDIDAKPLNKPLSKSAEDSASKHFGFGGFAPGLLAGGLLAGGLLPWGGLGGGWWGGPRFWIPRVGYWPYYNLNKRSHVKRCLGQCERSFKRSFHNKCAEQLCTPT